MKSVSDLSLIAQTIYKPTKYNSLSPYLVVDGAQKMIDLLKNIFGVIELRRYENPDGTIMHAEVMLDDSVVMIGDSSEHFSSNQHPRVCSRCGCDLQEGA